MSVHCMKFKHPIIYNFIPSALFLMAHDIVTKSGDWKKLPHGTLDGSHVFYQLKANARIVLLIVP